MKRQYAIIGLGRFGASIAKELSAMGSDVLAIDADQDLVEEISKYVTHAVQTDATDEKALKALGIRNFDVAVVAIGNNIQASILITMLCKEMDIDYVLVKAQNDLHAKVLYKIGADIVVFPERDMGVRVAHNLTAPNILDYIELSPDYSLVEISAIGEWKGKSLIELDFRKKYGVNIMAIKHPDGSINISPLGRDIIGTDDIIVVIGSTANINRLEKENSQKTTQ